MLSISSSSLNYHITSAIITNHSSSSPVYCRVSNNLNQGINSSIKQFNIVQTAEYQRQHVFHLFNGHSKLYPADHAVQSLEKSAPWVQILEIQLPNVF